MDFVARFTYWQLAM